MEVSKVVLIQGIRRKDQYMQMQIIDVYNAEGAMVYKPMFGKQLKRV